MEQPLTIRQLYPDLTDVQLAEAEANVRRHHHWSHNAAYEETARRTAELFGSRSGAGLYWNYVFTVVWTADVIWLWSIPTDCHRPRWIVMAIHCFLAFLFFNATVVFASGWVWWLGLMVTVALGTLWVATREQRSRRSRAWTDTSDQC